MPCLNSPSARTAEVVKAQHYHVLQSKSRHLLIDYITHLSAGSYLIHLHKKSSLLGVTPPKFSAKFHFESNEGVSSPPHT